MLYYILYINSQFRCQLVTWIVICLAVKSEANTVTVPELYVPPVVLALSFQTMIVLLALVPLRVMKGLSAGIVTFSLRGTFSHYLVPLIRLY